MWNRPCAAAPRLGEDSDEEEEEEVAKANTELVPVPRQHEPGKIKTNLPTSPNGRGV